MMVTSQSLRFNKTIPSRHSDPPQKVTVQDKPCIPHPYHPNWKMKMEEDVAAGVGEQVEAWPAVGVNPDNFKESGIQWPCGKQSQRGNKFPLFHFFPSHFLQKHLLQWSRKLRSFLLWQGAQRRASVSHCAMSSCCPRLDVGDHGQSLEAIWWAFAVPWSSHAHNHQKDQLCQLLGDHLPCSGRRELLEGPNLTIRCGHSSQSAAEGTGLLTGSSSWLRLSGLPFISPNLQDVDCILTAIGFPSACLWYRICVLTSKPPPYVTTSIALIDEYLTHCFASVVHPCKYASVLPTWTSQIGFGGVVPGWGDALLLAQSDTNKPESSFGWTRFAKGFARTTTLILFLHVCAKRGLKVENLCSSKIECQWVLIATDVESMASTNATWSACGASMMCWLGSTVSVPRFLLDGAVQFVDQFEMGNAEPTSAAASACQIFREA